MPSPSLYLSPAGDSVGLVFLTKVSVSVMFSPLAVCRLAVCCKYRHKYRFFDGMSC